MISTLLARRSLKTRITLATLAIFLIGIWALALYVSAMLRQDMQRLLGAQQFSAVSLLADNIDQQLGERLTLLGAVANQVTPALMRDTAALQALVERRPALRTMFNAGAFITGPDGTAIASVPVAAGRVGINYMGQAHVAAALRQGQPRIGQPLIGAALKTPVFGMVVPLRDAGGQVIGALVGVTDLSRPNFLDNIAKNGYSKTGSYVLVARQSRRIVAATDKSSLVRPFPALGVAADIDRFTQGYEGSSRSVSPSGEEYLVTSKRIPAADWDMIILLPVQEAFAPVRDMQARMLWATLLFTLLAGALVWWLSSRMLRRQFSPMVAASRMLSELSETNQPARLLPISTQDEIGDLMASFNRVLEVLALREAALQESEQRHRTLVEWTPEATLIYRDGKILYVNPAAAKLFGAASADDLIGKSTFDLVHPRFRSIAMERAQQLAAQQGSVPMIEAKFVKLDGTPIDVEVQSRSIQRGGEPAILVVIHDVTQRKVMEDALRESEFRWKHAVEGSRDGVWDVNHQTGKAQYSKRWKEMLGYSESEILPAHREFLERIHPEDSARVAAIVRDYEDGKTTSYTAEFRLKCKDGSYKWILSRGMGLSRQADGKPLRMIGTHTDITERKDNEAALRAAKTEADEANRAKSRFLAAASHDLRQPLFALSLLVGLLPGKVRPEGSELVTSIGRCVDSLNKLLTDLLEVSKLEAGVITPKPSDFAIDDLLSELLVVHSVQAQQKGLSLRWRTCAVVARTDFELLRQIIGNFIANAVRYSSRGGVLIACRSHAGRQWVEVWDTGMGIPADKTQAIFEPFRQLDDDARTQGSGLGLTIAAKTAALLGLQIRVRSRLGRGSMFAVELPLGHLVTRRQDGAAPPRARPLRIAVVEDDARVLQAITVALQSMGHDLIAAATGNGLVAQLQGRAPDIVISDYRLAAGETGFDVIGAIRELFGNELPAILLTGDTDPALMRSMAERGITVIYKPLQIDALQNFILHAAQDAP